MAKYTYKFKLKVIHYYLNNDMSLKKTAKHFNIGSKTTVLYWVKKYEKHGTKGLIQEKATSYTGEFKQNVIEYMNINHLSLQETAFHFNLGSHNLVSKWVRIYYEEGPQALYEEHRGRPRNMSSKQKNKNSNKMLEEDLIAENQRLRMENEYLKKLNALVQERIKRESGKE